MDEVTRILKMVADGTVTPEQGTELIGALEGVRDLPAETVSGYDRKLLRIVVDSADGDKVNIQFPVRAVKKMLKATGKLPINVNMEGADMTELMEAVSEGLDAEMVGDFITVTSGDGDHVRIFVAEE